VSDLGSESPPQSFSERVLGDLEPWEEALFAAAGSAVQRPNTFTTFTSGAQTSVVVRALIPAQLLGHLSGYDAGRYLLGSHLTMPDRVSGQPQTVAEVVIKRSREQRSSKLAREAKLLRLAEGAPVPQLLLPSHPNLYNSVGAIAVEFVNGVQLVTLLREATEKRGQRLSDWAVEALAHALFEAVGALHDRDIAHRDLGWQNVIVRGARLSDVTALDRIDFRSLALIDLGYAFHPEVPLRDDDGRVIDSSDRTVHGFQAPERYPLWAGTPGRRNSPERDRGLRNDYDLDDWRRADLFQWGCVILAARCLQPSPEGQGRPLDSIAHALEFQGDGRRRRNAFEKARDELLRVASLPPALEQAVSVAMSYRPEDRDRESVATALRPVAGGRQTAEALSKAEAQQAALEQAESTRDSALTDLHAAIEDVKQAREAHSAAAAALPQPAAGDEVAPGITASQQEQLLAIETLERRLAEAQSLHDKAIRDARELKRELSTARSAARLAEDLREENAILEQRLARAIEDLSVARTFADREAPKRFGGTPKSPDTSKRTARLEEEPSPTLPSLRDPSFGWRIPGGRILSIQTSLLKAGCWILATTFALISTALAYTQIEPGPHRLRSTLFILAVLASVTIGRIRVVQRVPARLRRPRRILGRVLTVILALVFVRNAYGLGWIERNETAFRTAMRTDLVGLLALPPKSDGGWSRWDHLEVGDCLHASPGRVASGDLYVPRIRCDWANSLRVTKTGGEPLARIPDGIPSKRELCGNRVTLYISQKVERDGDTVLQYLCATDA
jgi:hypothetical protein